MRPCHQRRAAILLDVRAGRLDVIGQLGVETGVVGRQPHLSPGLLDRDRLARGLDGDDRRGPAHFARFSAAGFFTARSTGASATGTAKPASISRIASASENRSVSSFGDSAKSVPAMLVSILIFMGRAPLPERRRAPLWKRAGGPKAARSGRVA